MAEGVGKGDGMPTVGRWLECSGPDADIVISSRIRVARNVVGYPFKAKMSREDAARLCADVRPRIADAGLGPGLEFLALEQVGEIERLVLLERHVISLELANATGERGVVCDPEGSLAVMINEEDHLRVQVITSGLDLGGSLARMEAVMERLGAVLEFAFHPRFGYLTSCPTNVGTGMRVSVMLHLPGLVMARQMEKIFNSVAKMGLVVRGFFGEGTKAVSDLFQLSNQITLGRSPRQLLDDVGRALPKIVEWERSVRKSLLEKDRVGMEDRIWRAYGTLRSARRMTSEEAFEHLSLLRVGVHLDVLPELDLDVVNRIFAFCQPGHLQKALGGEPIEPKERDVARAELIRSMLP